MKPTLDTTIRDLVVSDFRAASVLHKFDIDFCCGGRRTVDDACREKHVEVDVLLAEIARVCAHPDAAVPRFDTWDAPALITYIVERHHAWVREALPAIVAHAQKAARSHGAHHPELHDIVEIMSRVEADMASHMSREEAILFPYIEDLFAAVTEQRPLREAFFGSVINPVAVMEHEHETVGRSMALVRDLTDGYRVPDDACTTYRICLQELEAFEQDLQAHVHLENNLLFPEALALEVRARH